MLQINLIALSWVRCCFRLQVISRKRDLN